MAGMLEGKVAIVTGGGGGIGRAAALELAKEGAAVIVNDPGAAMDGSGNDAGPAQRVVAEIEEAGGRAMAHVGSVADAAATADMVAQAVDRFGGIHAVVHSAGILRDRIFHQMTIEDWDAVVNVHLRGAFLLASAAARHFRRQENGAFVFMTSSAGLIGSVGQANYAAAKMGLVGLSRSIAMDMQRFNVRANCVAPLAFSRMTESIPMGTPEEQAAFIARRQALTPPERIAPLTAFLVSDAAKEVTGQVLGARGNEVYLYNQPRPIRTLHRGDGWTAQRLAEQLLPAWRGAFTPLERTRHVFGWEAI